ncbi:MAG: hypothetical protein KAS57_02140 [Gammaproteobacteria bacterium]|nr:hypothetical protein [Gammaproteobacteria bacterium]
MTDKNITLSLGIKPAEPLWKIAPTRDEDGNRAGDLLMIIPKLKTRPKHHIQKTLSEIEAALNQFKHLVLFANVDMKLNTLWVSFKAEPGMFAEIAAALQLHVPEAMVVGDMYNPLNNK